MLRVPFSAGARGLARCVMPVGRDGGVPRRRPRLPQSTETTGVFLDMRPAPVRCVRNLRRMRMHARMHLHTHLHMPLRHCPATRRDRPHLHLVPTLPGARGWRLLRIPGLDIARRSRRPNVARADRPYRHGNRCRYHCYCRLHHASRSFRYQRIHTHTHAHQPPPPKRPNTHFDAGPRIIPNISLQQSIGGLLCKYSSIQDSPGTSSCPEPLMSRVRTRHPLVPERSPR